MNIRQLRILHALERASKRNSFSEGWVTTDDIVWELDNKITPRQAVPSLNALRRRGFAESRGDAFMNLHKWRHARP